MILFDTSVLSRVFRRKRKGAAEHKLGEAVALLMTGDEALGVPGIVLQEVLSGIRSDAQFEELKSRLMSAFPILEADTAAHLQAARLTNECRRKGINVSGPDCLIAVSAINGEHKLFAVDEDFEAIARIAPLQLYAPEFLSLFKTQGK